MKDEPIYMEPRALEFLRAWPDVPEVLRPAYSRFYDAGLLWLDPNVDTDGAWPGALRLTERGEALFELVTSQSFNFFTVGQLSPIFPDGVSAEDIADPLKRILKDTIPAARLPASPSGLRHSLVRLGVALDRLQVALKDAARR